MSRKTLSILFVFALTFLAQAVVLNRASADPSNEKFVFNEPVSSDQLWSDVDEVLFQRSNAEREIIPLSYRTLRLNVHELKQVLSRAPMEFTDAARKIHIVITLAMPDGKFGRFRIEESPIMEPGLAEKFPEIKTYIGQGIDDPTATLRFDVTPFGFHAQILSEQNSVYIDPYAKGDTEHYISYFKRDVRKEGAEFECLVNANPETGKGVAISKAQMTVPPNGATLRTYRLALGATGEYTIAAGGTVPLAVARMATTMTRVNGIFEREVAVRMTLVAGNSALVFTDPMTDFYTNGAILTMIDQHQTTANSLIGAPNYDMGHVFGTAGGGAAAVSSTCVPADKGRGATGLPTPVGDPFDVDFVAHEMGHQHGGLHTFNTISGSCTPLLINPMSAYEPGSGSTPMSYVGTCAPSNLQMNADDYFHVRTLERMVAHITGTGSCAAATATGNTPPTVSAGADYTIPRNTPFTLTSEPADADGNPLTLCWEEYDLGPTSPPEGDADGMARPIFRSYPPVSARSRTFPSLGYILSGANVPPATYDCGLPAMCITGESLPNITRTMTFQVTARDNRAGGGGIVSDNMAVSIVAGAGPFSVTAPNTLVSWAGGSLKTVTWSVAGTSAAPVSTANVKISLSRNGGTSFPTVILPSTPNDGSELIVVPNIDSETARIKVEAVGNIFFDISDVNFKTTEGVVYNKAADFDGDAKADVSVFRPSEGSWYLLRSLLGFTGVVFGTSGDRPVPGDYDGDGKTDVALYRPSTSAWYRLNSSNGAFVSQIFGASGDIPSPGRFDSDNKTDLAVFRPGTGAWYVLRSTDGIMQGQLFGTSGDIPISGDYDGDGRTDFTVFRPSTGVWYSLQTTAGFFAFAFGISVDEPVSGDFDFDGKTDIAVYRPTTSAWYIQRSSLGFTGVAWGVADDLTAAADYDGDNRTDIAVFRPSTGSFYILQSTTGLLRAEQFGSSGDLNIPGAYSP